jgi:predicted ATP-binding protein involved in virulence
MTSTLSRFRIEALHNRHTIDLPITDNKLILIGKNGAGKSTVTNFLYFFLARQWHRMLPYEFTRVIATIDNKDIEIPKKDLARVDDITTKFLSMFTPRTSSRILDIAATETIENLSNPEHINGYATELGLPRSTFIEVLDQLLDSSEKLNQLNQDLGVLFPNPILYLPAHRRIEQHLSATFPEIADSGESRYSMERLTQKSQKSNHTELVHLGVKVVKETMQHQRQNIQDFVSVCNEYLEEKRLVYDNMSCDIILQQSDKISQNGQIDTLKMSMLSSGEMQIVSVFSQIYLSNISNYFVIIDEPELSLSIFWQKRFLPDILNSGRCIGLVAATHSPFISENGLDDYMRPLQLFVEPIDARS